MRIFSLLILLVVASALQSQVVVNENVKHSKYTFPLVASKIKATVCYDANDYPVVKKVAELFVSDIENVTGQRLKLADEWKKGRTVVIVGTIEKNQAIRQLASNGKIDISPLEGAWERYLIQTVNHPFPGVDKALIVAGSDRRGASYGLFSLSEMAGVSPWYWWADVPATHQDASDVNWEKGTHTLTVCPLALSMVLYKIVVNCGGDEPSHLNLMENPYRRER